MNNKQVAHLWAHQARQSARGSHFYFEGNTIYSYGPHFPIARLVENRAGQQAVLFTTQGYSLTTSTHKGYVRQAIPHGMPIFYMPDLPLNPAVALPSYTERALASVESSKAPKIRQKTRDGLLASAQELIEDGRKFAAFFGLNYAPPADLVAAYEAKAALLEQMRLKRERKAKRDAKKAMLEAREKVSAFIAGEDVTVPHLSVAYARIASDPANESVAPQLETTLGAYVPLDHVKRAWPIVREIVEHGREWQSNGRTIKVGHYQIDRIEKDGTLVAGCHRFEKAEVLRIGGLIETFYAK